MDNYPLLSIICTVYNQEDYVRSCLEALASLDYPDLECFIVDNGSQDGSRKIIEDWVDEQAEGFRPQTIFRDLSLPYCKSFNEVLSLVSGKYLIDLSGDDILLPQHALNSVLALERNPRAVVCFSDAFLSKNGRKKSFYPRDAKGNLLSPVKDGDLYKILVASHHVLSVTMVLRTEALKAIGGYDENLSYEDFDIQVRLARKHPFVFSDHHGIIKNLHPKAYSAKQYQRYRSVMLPSTLSICHKIKAMNQNDAEDAALLQRLNYELKHSLFSANFEAARGFYELAVALGGTGSGFVLYRYWLKYRWDFSGFYAFLKKTFS